MGQDDAGRGPERNAMMHISLGYIDGPLRVRFCGEPETRDGKTFYSVVVRGSTVNGEAFNVSVYSAKPIDIEGEMSEKKAKEVQEWVVE